MTKMTPMYNTMTFSDIYNSSESFVSDYENVGFPTTISNDSAETLFYLLFARYGNNPIANADITQFKYKLFSIVYQYGPTWEKKLDIQSKLRELTDEDIEIGGKAVYNRALNPSIAPSTSALDELEYINEQNTTNYKKSKMDAYTQLYGLLEDNITEFFIRRFKVCFKVFANPETTLLYITETDNEGDE